MQELIDMQVEISHQSNLKDVGKVFEVLVEGVSKKKSDELFGRSSQNKVIVFPDNGAKVGELVQVRVTECTPATLIGEAINQYLIEILKRNSHQLYFGNLDIE